MNPELLRRVSPGLEQLNSVRDLEGNMLSVCRFLIDPVYRHLKSLTLENQLLADSEVSVITRLPALKKFKLSYHQITSQGFSEITTMQGGWKI